VKRPLCIALWTVAAVVFAYKWKDLTVGISEAIAQRVASNFQDGRIALRLMHFAFDAVPWVFCAMILALGLLGVLPGTRRVAKIASPES
jgi:hypothetical protein